VGIANGNDFNQQCCALKQFLLETHRKKIDQQKLDFLPTSLLAWNILESVETSVSAILKENETIFYQQMEVS
jgi:hypothetical protein